MMRVRALLLVLVGALMLSACSFDVYKLPLPGGTSVGDDPITVTVDFEDVLDLVPKTTVKVNDVSVGQVTDVALDGQHARVTLQLRKDVRLPDNAIAEIRQTSLLGEKFVSLSAPPDGASSGMLASGDNIGLDRSGRNPEVEEVLGALSLLLNGGGVAQLKTIMQELNKALEGREDSARSVLDQIRILVTQLDDNRTKIVDAIDSLNNLAISVHEQQGSIDSALEELPSALTSLEGQRADLVKMLQALNRLGGVGVRVIQASKAATIDTFRQLQPVLTELANSGDDFVKAFNVFLTYPFVDEVVGRDPQVARNLQMGDYTNLSAEIDLSVEGGPGPSLPTPTLPSVTLPTIIDPTDVVNDVLDCLNTQDPLSAECQNLSNKEIKRLKRACKKPKNQDNPVCIVINTTGGGGGGGGGGGLPTSLPTSLPTLPRTAFGPTAGWSTTRGPTMGQLMKQFDPALVSLLVPGMVSQ